MNMVHISATILKGLACLILIIILFIVSRRGLNAGTDSLSYLPQPPLARNGTLQEQISMDMVL